MKIGFLHIGRTGGASLRAALEAGAARSGLDLVWHCPDMTLKRALTADPDRPIAFVYRDPAERFVSAFRDRLRMGRPGNNTLWSAEEAIAFQWFETPNSLAEALYSDDERMVSASRFAMHAITPVRRGLAWRLGSALELEKAGSRILFACDLADLDGRLEELCRRIGLPRPERSEHLHVRPDGRSRADELSDLARGNLERFLHDDFLIHRYLTAKFGGDAAMALREEADTAGDRALDQYRARDWANAVANCSRTLEIRPLDRRALLLRARALGQQNENDAALKDWESVLFLDPDNSEALVSLGRLLHRARRSDEALPHLERAHRLEPEDPNIRRLLLTVAEAAGNAAALRRTIGADSRPAREWGMGEDWRPAASLFALERDEAAVEAVCRARMETEEDDDARLMLARQMIQQQRLAEAERLINPEQARADRTVMLGLVQAALRRRDIPTARERLQTVRSQGPENQLVRDTAGAIDRMEAEIAADAGLDRHGVTVTALLGVSYCGSTMLGSMLGNLDGVGHVGESHRMIKSDLKLQSGNPDTVFDFERGDRNDLTRCESCGIDCDVFPFEFRRSLRDEPANWYFRIADRLGVRHLVSGDKQMAPELDPLERFNAVIMFKPPEAAFGSNWRRSQERPHEHWHVSDPARYGDIYALDYRRLLHRVRPEGRTICLNWMEFVAEPEWHLSRLCEMLGLPFDAAALTRWDARQHFFGGNRDVRHEFREHPANLKLRGELQTEMSDDLLQAIRGHQPMQSVFEEMMVRYRADFARPGTGEQT